MYFIAPWRLGIIALIAYITSTTTVVAQQCTPPDHIVFGNQGELVFRGDPEHVAPMEPMDWIARALESLAILVPGIASVESRVHLYSLGDASFLSRYDDIEESHQVGFYAACKEGGVYAAMPGTVSRAEGSQPSGTTLDGVYIGLTIRPEGTTPDVTLRQILQPFP